jgi:site-specific recombinase XerC
MNQPAAHSSSSGIPFPRAPQVIFSNWLEALHQSGSSSAIQTVYSMAVQADVATTQIYTHV